MVKISATRYKFKAQRMFLSAQSCNVTNRLFARLAVKPTFKTTFERVSHFLIFSLWEKNDSKGWIKVWMLHRKIRIRPGLWITKRTVTIFSIEIDLVLTLSWRPFTYPNVLHLFLFNQVLIPSKTLISINNVEFVIIFCSIKQRHMF